MPPAPLGGPTKWDLTRSTHAARRPPGCQLLDRVVTGHVPSIGPLGVGSATRVGPVRSGITDQGYLSGYRGYSALACRSGPSGMTVLAARVADEPRRDISLVLRESL